MPCAGRQSLTRLAAFAMELTCYSIELSRAYGPAEWRDDIKNLLLKSGLQMRGAVFLFSDTQVRARGCSGCSVEPAPGAHTTRAMSKLTC